ncbi:MAG: aldehyde dehydrogenase family protein [Halobacteriovoraceae bacterium]|nr:aldehyde dehydrogenase family protein [Halobacteriovoraceae bacterium]
MKIINYIGGELVPPLSKKYLDNINPATGEKYGQVADSIKEDVDLAVEKASNAFNSWAALSKKKRAEYLFTFASLIEKNQKELSYAECLDTGKPISLAQKVDIPRSAANFRFFAEKILKFEDVVFPGEKHGIKQTVYFPL